MNVQYNFYYAFLTHQEILRGVSIEKLRKQNRLPAFQDFYNAIHSFTQTGIACVLQDTKVVPQNEKEAVILFDKKGRVLDHYNPLRILRPEYAPIPVLHSALVQIIIGSHKKPHEQRQELMQMIKTEYNSTFEQEIRRIKIYSKDEMPETLDADLEGKIGMDYTTTVFKLNQLAIVKKTGIKELAQNPDYEKLGTAIREQRTKYGLTQDEWATLYICDKMLEISFGLFDPQQRTEKTSERMHEELEKNREARKQMGDGDVWKDEDLIEEMGDHSTKPLMWTEEEYKKSQEIVKKEQEDEKKKEQEE